MFSINFSVIKMCILLLRKKKIHNRIKWRWKSDLRILAWLMNCPWGLAPMSGKAPHPGLVWGWGFNSPFSFSSCFPKSLRYPGTSNHFFKWFLETYHPAPAPTQACFPLPLHLTSSGEKALKSQSIRGSIHMPTSHFLMLKRNKKHLHEIWCWCSLLAASLLFVFEALG